MPEDLGYIIERLPSGDDLMRRVIQIQRREKPFAKSRARTPDPLWWRVMEVTGHGSGWSRAICIKYGFDPDETWQTT